MFAFSVAALVGGGRDESQGEQGAMGRSLGQEELIL